LKTINLCHIITTSELGGAQLSTYRILIELAKQSNLNIFLIYGTKGPLSQDFQNLKNVTVIRLNKLNRTFSPLKDLLSLIQVITIIKKKKIQIIHTHSSKASLIGRLAGIITRIKIIHTYHGFGHDFFLNKYLRLIYIAVERFLNHHSHKLIFVCKTNLNKALHLKLTSSEKSIIIPDTLNLKKLSSIKYDKNNSNHNITVGTVLSFKEQKQPFQILKLIKMLDIEFEKINFVLIGEGPLLEETKIRAKKLKIQNITFTGAQKDIIKYYQQFNLFIHASRYEGLSMAQIEALYLNIPIVITNQGGISEILEHGKQGFMYHTGDLKTAFEYCKIILNNNFKYQPLNNTIFDAWATKTILDKHISLYNTL